MNFREMDPNIVREMLEATNESGQKIHQDVLTPLMTKEDALFRTCPCPKCGSMNHRAEIDVRRPFVPGNPLPHRNLHCLDCETLFDPYTRLILSTPSTE